jgi:aryl-alcohol dehydrogenase-like predicted oxidoreductase
VTAWLEASELRVGLGCMRLDGERGAATIAAAAESGITIFDTARAYGASPGDGERLLAAALGSCGAAGSARIVTKGGMTRAGSTWIPDGRAKAIRADCEASLAALGGLSIDLYLLHAPDWRRPWSTALRALARLVDEGLVRRIGIANVNRRQLDEALALAPVAAVQVALSVFDDRPLRGGVVERCSEAGIAVIAHSPLGGSRRAGTLERRGALVELARAHGATPAEVALAWLLELSPAVVPIPGATRPDTARSAARAAAFELASGHRADRTEVRPKRRARRGDVVLVAGIPGSGKSRLAEGYVERGYVRLNRDERGGSQRTLAAELDRSLEQGVRRAVLDNTYLTRAARSHAIEAAARHDLPVRCLWLDTPLAQAQINMVERLLDRFGALPSPAELRAAAGREQGLLAPTSQMRAVRELEPPSLDEGFAAVERVAFEREPANRSSRRAARGRESSRPGRRRAPRGSRSLGTAPALRLVARRRLVESGEGCSAAERGRLGPCRARALPASRWTAELLVSATPPGPRPRLRPRSGRKPRTIDADRDRRRPPPARGSRRSGLPCGMTAGRIVVGVLLCLVGGVWLGQGLGLIHGSFMTGEAQWAVIGGVLIALGAGLLVWAWRVH